MTQSNSKLTKVDKLELKKIKLGNPDIKLFCFPNTGVTVAITKQGAFAVSILGKDEKKFRPKVGELWALRRFSYGQCLPYRTVDDADDTDLYCVAVSIANAIA